MGGAKTLAEKPTSWMEGKKIEYEEEKGAFFLKSPEKPHKKQGPVGGPGGTGKEKEKRGKKKVGQKLSKKKKARN